MMLMNDSQFLMNLFVYMMTLYKSLRANHKLDIPLK